jgi:cold shock protein
MATGTVKWFDNKKGMGFIKSDESKSDVFVHHSGITGDKTEYKTLEPGQLVQFDLINGPKGPKAIAVTVARAAEKFHG